MNVSRPGPVYTNSDTFQWWIQGRGPPPLFFLRPEGPKKKFFFSPSPAPPFLSEGLDGAFNLYGGRSHKDTVSVCGFPFVRVGGKLIRQTKNE